MYCGHYNSDAKCKGGTPHLSGASDFTTGFCELRIVRSLGFCVLFCIFVCLFLSVIALSVLFRFTDSDYPFGIFQLSLFLTNQLSLRLQLQPIIVVLVSHLYPFLISMQVL